MARRGLFSTLLGVFKPGGPKADIHTASFKVHFQLTPKLMFSFLLLVIAYNLFSAPIRCFGRGLNFKEEALNDYCWTQNTFLRQQRRDDPHPFLTNDDSEQIYFRAHSQLVPLVLFLQGLVFCIPNWLWKCCEGGKLRSLSVPFLDTEMRLQKTQALAKYLHTSLHQHTSYAISYFVCDMLNLVFCFFNLWFMDMFLGEVFFARGLSVMDLFRDSEDAKEATAMTFPRTSKCQFYIFGNSGAVERYDLICTLTHSAMYLKMFAFLWLYFVILSCFGVAMLLSCLVIYSSASAKSHLLRKQGNLSIDNVDALITKLETGDFFLLYLLSKNVDFHVFGILIEDLSARVMGRKGAGIYPELEDKATDITPV
ncbi:innexin inx3-like [Penaeus chinensis]|uniref:innexin inx3-like n=1 Tax=Penaeus chinensis TaxID=139456 RepID=UPI001FB6CB9D|nr:innexin inx3-like [Penaeus chinensis]